VNAGKPILHLICGKIASGKSTLARQLAAEPHTALVREDHWLSNLYPDEMKTVQDYVKYSGRLRGALEEHLVSLLESGLSVVLDFPANTVGLRTWMRTLFEKAGTEHELHYLDAPEAVCKERLKRRNEDGSHEFAPSDEQCDLINRYFEPPTEEEGFTIILHRAD
jgi:predicted kinase